MGQKLCQCSKTDIMENKNASLSFKLAFLYALSLIN